jgi:ribonuclease BN (tRNA processing enzyme)
MSDPSPPPDEFPDVAEDDAGQERRKDAVKRRRLLSRRGLLTATAGLAAGAAAGWIVAETSTSPVVTTVLPAAGKLDHDLLWTTLGTMGGPIASTRRAQPANLLHNAGQAILIDSGDGAADQLGKAGVDLTAVATVILSHLHIDHTAGLYGVIGRRLQERIAGTLSIYGPPGTRQEVDRMQASLGYLSDLMHAGNSRVPDLPPTTVDVIEVTDGSTFTVGPVKVTAATNTHYGFAPASAQAARFQSLSFRFDMPDRSIAYTGDTGPSGNVQRLAHGADLLISEIINADQSLAALKAQRSDIPIYAEPILKQHFEKQHLSADEVGLLARRSGVKAVVLTHNPLTDPNIEIARATIASHFNGPVAFADDLDNY